MELVPSDLRQLHKPGAIVECSKKEGKVETSHLGKLSVEGRLGVEGRLWYPVTLGQACLGYAWPCRHVSIAIECSTSTYISIFLGIQQLSRKPSLD